MPTNVPGQAIPLTEAATENEAAKEAKARGPRTQKQRGPPEDGIPSKTKVMVANLPYDLNEEKVCHCTSARLKQKLMHSTAQGTFQGLRTRVRQDRSSPYSSLHD